jgi:Ribbon-helix-helix protein, copG family.
VLRVTMDRRYLKKRLYITLDPDEITLLEEYAKKDHKRSLSSMIGKMIRNYKTE